MQLLLEKVNNSKFCMFYLLIKSLHYQNSCSFFECFVTNHQARIKVCEKSNQREKFLSKNFDKKYQISAFRQKLI